MESVLHFVGDYWWLVFPVGGVVGGWAGHIARYNEKRRRDKIELARIKANARTEQLRITQASAAQIRKALHRHDDLDRRWFGYELDLATLIDFPLMIDMREPLTLAFHRAKLHADELRPASEQQQMSPTDFGDYRDAVAEYAAAFDAAEREARRRKQSGFSPVEREALDRAAKLVAVASDSAATPAERQAAYRRARAELDGLIDVPAAAAAELESRIAGQLERGTDG
ncbi:hypothetical protein QSJ18_00565 [Gordonia sp. ABSL1-1]|uniref:hypothetical protein n=1 Tax=Gordonia sp. ABSL1-1 TaxID=3053923 RepID=UPI002573D194|nr:hypothetical protein [Gordonia sp. ABSL1-1]MDL9935228.1 hypothetical protein [Gordonia sp. ABSL1-1]